MLPLPMKVCREWQIDGKNDFLDWNTITKEFIIHAQMLLRGHEFVACNTSLMGRVDWPPVLFFV
jgi:hypothetical protein